MVRRLAVMSAMAFGGYVAAEFSGSSAMAQSASQTAKAEQLAQIYRDTADLPEFTQRMIRMKALSDYSSVDLSSAGKPNAEFDEKYPKSIEYQSTMYPEDAARLATDPQRNQ
jgi:hypothetical protein